MRFAARRSSCSAARTRWARRGHSRRCTMTHSEARERAAAMLADAGIVLTPAERDAIEVTDLGLGRLGGTRGPIVAYANTDRVCAKALVLFSRQICPEHRHPPVGGEPGKEETFRCRTGIVHLHVEG